MSNLNTSVLAILREHSPVDVLTAVADILGEHVGEIDAFYRRRGVTHCASPSAVFFGAASVIVECARRIEGRNWPSRSALCEPLRGYND